MSKTEKILKKWRNKPTIVRKEEVLNILRKYGFEIEHKKGSHIIVRHEKLIGKCGFGILGDFTVPVKNGRDVKGFYLKQILKAIEIIEE